MYKLFVLFIVTVSLIESIQSLPSLWRKSARSDSSPKQFLTTTTATTANQNAKFIDLTFLQNLPRLVFGQLKRPQQKTEFISFNSLSKPSQFDSSYHAYETLPNEATINFKSTANLNKPIKNELDGNSNDLYAPNESYEDDDVIVIPFTKHRGQASFGDLDKQFPNAKNEQGVPSAIGYDSSNHQVINKGKPIDLNRKFDSKIITDSEEDLDTGDELPSSLSADDEDEKLSPDFKVQFSDLHPVYVVPPSNFQPVLYPNREVDGVDKLIKRNDNQATIKPLLTDERQERPNKYPNGLSGWLLGGYRSMQRGAYWENLASDSSLHGYKTSNDKKIELELNENSLDRLDQSSDLNAEDKLIKNENNFEFLPLNEPKSSRTAASEEDNIDLKQKIKLNKKFKKTFLSKNSQLKRKLNLKPKKVKILTKANKLFDNNVKKLN